MDMGNNKVNLKEYVHPKMDLLFVALNAPEVSNRNAHWFSRNLSFWNLIFDAGIITKTIVNPLEGDENVFGNTSINYKNWRIGVTDLNRAVVATKSNSVTTNSEQVKRILQILETTSTNRMCLMHSKVADEFAVQGIIKRNYQAGKNIYGKVGRYKNTEIFEVPFHNASVPDKKEFYKLIIS